MKVDGKRFFAGKVSCVLAANVGKILGGVEAFPQAVFDDSSEDVFGIIVRIAKGDGGPMEMALDKKGRVDQIGIPHLVFCE